MESASGWAPGRVWAGGGDAFPERPERGRGAQRASRETQQPQGPRQGPTLGLHGWFVQASKGGPRGRRWRHFCVQDRGQRRGRRELETREDISVPCTWRGSRWAAGVAGTGLGREHTGGPLRPALRGAETWGGGGWLSGVRRSGGEPGRLESRCSRWPPFTVIGERGQRGFGVLQALGRWQSHRQGGVYPTPRPGHPPAFRGDGSPNIRTSYSNVSFIPLIMNYNCSLPVVMLRER